MALVLSPEATAEWAEQDEARAARRNASQLAGADMARWDRERGEPDRYAVKAWPSAGEAQVVRLARRRGYGEPNTADQLRILTDQYAVALAGAVDGAQAVAIAEAFERQYLGLRAVFELERAQKDIENRERAGSRAKKAVRLYAKANRLRYMWTLTYRVKQLNPKAVKADVARFMKRLNEKYGSLDPKGHLAYIVVLEWHKEHGLHVHFLLAHFLPVEVIRPLWQKVSKQTPVWSSSGPDRVLTQNGARVNAKRFKARRGGKGAVASAAAYVSKYVGKGFEDAELGGAHRYEVAQGHQPEVITAEVEAVEAARLRLAELFGGVAEREITSLDWPNWKGPQVTCFYFVLQE